jgi:hypothetical protein
LGPGPLKVPTLVIAGFDDPVWFGTEMLPICPGSETDEEAPAELP